MAENPPPPPPHTHTQSVCYPYDPMWNRINVLQIILQSITIYQAPLKLNTENNGDNENRAKIHRFILSLDSYCDTSVPKVIRHAYRLKFIKALWKIITEEH